MGSPVKIQSENLKNAETFKIWFHLLQLCAKSNGIKSTYQTYMSCLNQPHVQEVLACMCAVLLVHLLGYEMINLIKPPNPTTLSLAIFLLTSVVVLSMSQAFTEVTSSKARRHF